MDTLLLKPNRIEKTTKQSAALCLSVFLPSSKHLTSFSHTWCKNISTLGGVVFHCNWKILVQPSLTLSSRRLRSFFQYPFKSLSSLSVEILGSVERYHQDCGHLRSEVIETFRYETVFRRTCCLYLQGSFEMLVLIYRITQYNTPEECDSLFQRVLIADDYYHPRNSLILFFFV